MNGQSRALFEYVQSEVPLVMQREKPNKNLDSWAGESGESRKPNLKV